MLIAFEGGEGCGKSTQARRLAERIGAVFTHEPGGTALGTALRSLLLDPSQPPLAPTAEALLLAADRAQHVVEVLSPALARGDTVVTDRYVYSTLAYQGYGRGLPLDELRALSQFAGAPEADVVVLLAVPDDVRRARLGRELDRIEAADDGFHERVAAGFLALAQADPDRWIVIDGSPGPDDVAAAIWSAVSPRLRGRP